MDLYLNSFSLFAPGLLTPDDFRAFLSGRRSMDADFSSAPPVDFVPAMHRRKFSQLIKMTLYVAENATPPGMVPSTVYASRFGEWVKTFKQIEKYHTEHAVSPTGFGMTVHNAAAGCLAMLKNNTASYTASAAGKDTFDAGLLEALTKTRREDDVLFIYADEKIPDFYLDTFTEKLFPIALSCTFSTHKKSDQALFLSVSFDAPPPPPLSDYMSRILDFSRFLLFPETDTFFGKHAILRKKADVPSF